MSHPADEVLRAEHVAVSYGSIRALRDASLTIGTGEVVAVLGPNGAGKSTLARTITGLMHAETGSVWIQGTETTRTSPQRIAGLGVSIVPEGRRIFAGLSVLDNLLTGAFRWRGDRNGTTKTLGEVYELFPLLRERSSQLGGSLSGGEQQMLAVGRALMSRPSLLILDEPSLGLAPRAVAGVYAALRTISEAGTALLLIEQNTRLVASIASSAYLMARGITSEPRDPAGIHATASGHYLGEDAASGAR
jgi:branched-chain amino acid transport system ATP-binding protein